MNAIEREAKKQKFLRNFTEKYIHLIPEYLRDNDSFLVFFALLCHEFNITLDNVRSFNDIINPDKVPPKFIEYLGMYFNNHYIDRAPLDFNRELITRSRKLFEDRGNEHSIIMAATHGDNEGYLGGDIFIPGYDINEDLAELVVARERLFYHSKHSNFSSFHVYSDKDTYRPGILIIILSYLDSDIRNKLWEVIPAGIKLRYNILIDFRPNKQDPIDLYDFDPPTGAAKSKERTLTWYPYFRVVPIIEHGDLKTSVNNPIGFDYFIDMGVSGGFSNDILIHSDGTINKWLFNEDGLLQGGLNDIRLFHGRKLHSGTKVVDVHYTNEHNIGVSALPLSKVRKPFPLSSLPENPNIIETDEEVTIRPGYYNEIVHVIPEKDPFKHSKVKSKHSGEDVFGGTPEETTETEQEYVEPEKIIIKKRDYNFYRITPTGEYEDRIDKLTTDSVMRGLDTTLDLETKVQKFHNPRRFSHQSGRHSGTYYNDKLNSIIHSIFLDGVADRTPYKDVMDIEYYAKNKIVEDLTQSVDLIEEHIELYGKVLSLEKEIKELEIQLSKLNPAAYNYVELQDEIGEKKNTLYGYTKRIAQIIDTVNGIRLEILQIFDDGMEDHPINKQLKKTFEELYKWYPAQNAIMSGIFIPGDVNEYVPIMTIQPFDTLYPISEILDEKADFNRPWDRKWWDGSEETKHEYGLNQYGENRNPFYMPEIKYSTVYEPTTDGKNINISYHAVHGLDVHHIEDANIVKDANKTLIHSAYGDILSGRFLLEIIHEREDESGVVTETKSEFIHNKSKFSGETVFGGTSKEVLDRMWYTDMDSHIDPDLFVEIFYDYEVDESPDVYDIEIDVEDYRRPGSVYSITYSSDSGIFSGSALYDGRVESSEYSSLMTEPIINMRSSKKPCIISDITTDIDISSYNVSIGIETLETEVT